MELNINVETNNNCKIVVTDVSNYLSEDFTGIVKGKFKYSDTISINILQHNKTKETIYRDPIFTKHDTLEPIDIPIEFDGWFDVIHLVLPTAEWFNNERNKSGVSAIDLYDLIYFSDGVFIYKYINDTIYQVTINEVLEVNPVNTTISKTNKDYISICFLKKCYINMCQQIFENRAFSKCFDRNKIDSELIYKRDLVLMAINVIKYLTECKQLAEVERIVEILNGCNGLCNSSNIINSANGCGCS